MSVGLSVYVGGSSKEIERVRRVMRALEDAGYDIAFDWTLDVEESRRSGLKSDADLTLEQAVRLSKLCLMHLSDADYAVFLVPADERATKGMWVELGHAIAYNAGKILVSGANARSCLFSYHPTVDWTYDVGTDEDTDEEMLDHFRFLAAEADGGSSEDE